jgi:dienelactone hydrolase
MKPQREAKVLALIAESQSTQASASTTGRAIAKNADLKPKVPTLLHFGDRDQSIPLSDVASRCGRAPRSRKRGAFQKHITGVLCHE